MSAPVLTTVEFESAPQPTATVIALHGIGADAHYFEPIVRSLATSQTGPLRFVLPNAPVRPVTLSGQSLRAWYDIRNVDRQRMQDESAIRESAAAIAVLIDREQQRGISSDRIVLVGFSQGGAMALFTGTRYARPLAGIAAMSCYPLLAESFATERNKAPERTPIFLAHGEHDPVIDLRLGQLSREQLEGAGYPVEWHTYPIGHELSPEELATMAAFIARVLSREQH